jgi:hypothetical protein
MMGKKYTGEGPEDDRYRRRLPPEIALWIAPLLRAILLLIRAITNYVDARTRLVEERIETERFTRRTALLNSILRAPAGTTVASVITLIAGLVAYYWAPLTDIFCFIGRLVWQGIEWTVWRFAGWAHELLPIIL